MDIHTITILVTNFASLFVLERLMKVFYGERRTTLRVMLLLYFLVFSAFVIQYFLFQHSGLMVQSSVDFVINLVGYFVITLNYRSSIIKRIAVVVFIYPLFLLVVSLSTFVVGTILPELKLGSEALISISSVVASVIMYLFAIFLLRFKNIRKTSTFFPTVLITPIIVMLVLGVLWYVGVTGLADPNTVEKLGALFLFILLITFCFLGFYLYNKLSKLYEEKLNLALQAQEREYYLAQCQLMQNSVEQVRAIRHDMKSHLATVRGLSKDKKAEEVTTYVDSLLGDIRTSEVYSDTGNIVFDSILNFKLQNAQEDNVRIDLHLFIPNSLTMEITDIATILGNLIDNSLTAISKVSEKWIKIDMEYSRKCLFIQVQNSFDGNVIYSNEETKEIQSSKTAENSASEEHGFGLKNIKKAVEKYNGQMDITHADKVFSVTILLYGV